MLPSLPMKYLFFIRLPSSVARLLICWNILVCSLAGQAQTGAPVLKGDSTFLDSRLQGHLWCLADTSSSFTVNTFLQAMRTGKSGWLSHLDVTNLGSQNNPYWVGFRFQSGFRKAQILVVDFDFFAVDALTCWVWQGNRLVKASPVTSWRTEPARRDVPHRTLAFRFVAQPGQTYDCVLRLQKQDGGLVVPVTLSTEADFFSYTTRDSLMHGMAAGCLGLAIVLGLSFCWLTQQTHYAYYAGYVLGVMLFLLEEQGYLNGLMLGRSDLLAGPNAWIICSLIAIIGHTLFVIQFLRLDQVAGQRWARVGWFICLLCGFMLLPSLLGYSSDTFYELTLVINLVYVSLLFVYLFVAYRYKHSETLLYFLAGGPFFLTVVWLCFSMLGLLPQAWLLYGLLNNAPVWEVAILCIGLAIRFSREQQQKVVALQESARLEKEMVRMLDEAQESERQRIARDLHDDVGNTLAAAKGSLNTISKKLIIQTEFPEVAKAQRLIEKAGQDLRIISHNLMPIDFETYTLSDVIRQTVERADNSAVAIQFEYVQAGTERQLTPERSIIIYRIVNELINNIQKHSGASRAIIQLIFQPESLIVTAEDNGKGFQVTNSDVVSSGIGLKNVSSRSNYIGATLDISSDTSGTCVIVEVPYA